jgi:hypothetical protein
MNAAELADAAAMFVVARAKSNLEVCQGQIRAAKGLQARYDSPGLKQQ